MSEIDFDSAYSIEGYRGIAWYLQGYKKVRDEDYEWSGIEYEDKNRVEAIMIGDDRVFVFDTKDLHKLDEEEYCPDCGQIGCGGANV